MLESNLPAYYLNLDDSLPGFTTSVLRSGKPTRICAVDPVSAAHPAATGSS